MQDNKRLYTQDDLYKQRLTKLEELKNLGVNPFDVVKFETTSNSSEIFDNFEKLENTEVIIAGRMITRRIMGKASFFNLLDSENSIQVYIKRDDVGSEIYSQFKKYDLGDHVGVRGTVFRTQKGEISVHANEIRILSKSLMQLPEKFHGLSDLEVRYRQRYLDLIANRNVKDVFVKRSKIIKSIRDFLEQEGYLEVETPILQSIASGASAKPFNTHHNALNIPLVLRISLELHLKRLIVGGFDKVFEMGRTFRNEGISTRHNPEFTLLELYSAYEDYHDMMNLCENLIKYCAQKSLGTVNIVSSGVEFELDKPFRRATMLDLVKEYSKIDFNQIESDEEAKQIAKEHDIKTEKLHKKGDILNLFFEKYVEEHLIQPTFVMDYPIEISPLAKKKLEDPMYTQRFELFILGREHANAFSELNDPIDQYERFMQQMKLRAGGDEEAQEIDYDFIKALEYGMPPTGGMGIGVDRLIMFLTNSVSIRDVLLFPTMKELD